MAAWDAVHVAEAALLAPTSCRAIVEEKLRYLLAFMQPPEVAA